MLANTPSFDQPITIEASPKASYESMLQNTTKFNADIVLVTALNEDASVSKLLKNAQSFNRKLFLNLDPGTDVTEVLANCSSMAFSVGCWNTSLTETDVQTKCQNFTGDGTCTRCYFEEEQDSELTIPRTQLAFTIISMISFFFTIGNMF